MKEKELIRLIRIAQLYYEENKTQAEIAKEMNISRPSVSNLLQKARKEGVVKIEVLSYHNTSIGISQELCHRFNLKSCHVVLDPDDIFKDAGEFLLNLLSKTKILGLGWGYNINKIVENFPDTDASKMMKGIVCPLIGTATVPHRGYHPNELATDFSHKTSFEPEFLISPAFPTTEQEQELFMNTDNYKQMLERWKKVDTALVTLGSYPLVPDHGTALRFGKKLMVEKAVGNLLSYFFNKDGELIKGDDDYAIQIPLPLLSKIKNLVGIAPQESNIISGISCLKTGYIKHLIISEQTAGEILKFTN
ncbi:MAG: sugar-binding transcriptional regulator [Eubacteriaceae bacterium]